MILIITWSTFFDDIQNCFYLEINYLYLLDKIPDKIFSYTF